MSEPQLQALARYRRSQRLLLLGGGVLTTLMVILTFALGIQTRLRVHLDAQRQGFVLSRSLVEKYGPSALMTPFAQDDESGCAMILSAGGVALASGGEACEDAGRLPPALVQALLAAAGPEPQELYWNGGIVIAGAFGDEDHVLVHAYSPRGMAAALGWNVGADAAMSLATLAIMWLCAAALKLRVFRPLLEWSRQIYDSETLSRTLIDTAPVGLGLISVDSGKPLLWSPSMTETVSRIAVPADTLSDELTRRYRARLTDGGAGWRRGPLQEELGFPTHDGREIDLSVSMARARYQGQDVLVTAFVDVTAKKRVEQQLRKARQAADSANAAKSAFLAAMSHEIRTPLNAILGNLELLSHSPLNAAQRDRLDTIRSASDGLLSVVSDVLDFSKIEAGELRLEEIEFDALEVASRALRMFAPMAQACGLALVGELGLAVSQPMRGDPTRLGQILHNLLSNAIKFTNAGKVTLRLALDEAGSQAAFVVEDTGIGMSAEQMARLFRAFSQGDATISRRFGGTGLGLALCSRLAQAMGGTMAAESEPGLGSRFTLRLPLGECAGERDLPRFDGQSVVLVAAFEAERAYVGQALSAWGLRPQGYGHPAQVGQRELEGAAALVLWGARQTWLAADENRLIEESAWVIDCAMSGPGLPTAAGRLLSVSMYGLGGLAGALRHALQGRALAPASPGRRVLARPLRILVAEDNLVNRRLFEEQLALLGCEVRTAEDGEAALAWLEREEYDVLLTDLAMPGLDGYELARRALRRWPSLPVVAATAHVTPQERERCAQAGMARVLGKPLSLEELGRTLSELTGIAWGPPMPAEPADDPLGGQALPEGLRSLFLESCETSLSALKQAQQDGDAQRLRAELHSLSGMLGVFRMRNMRHKLVDVETRFKQGDVDASHAVKLLLEELEAGLRRARVAPQDRGPTRRRRV